MSKWTFEDVDVRSEVVRHADEHEVFIEFNSDDLAVLFHEWWNNEGIAVFIAWANSQENRDG